MINVMSKKCTEMRQNVFYSCSIVVTSEANEIKLTAIIKVYFSSVKLFEAIYNAKHRQF